MHLLLNDVALDEEDKSKLIERSERADRVVMDTRQESSLIYLTRTIALNCQRNLPNDENISGRNRNFSVSVYILSGI